MSTPSTYSVQIDRNELGAVDAIRVIDVAHGTTFYDAIDDDEIARLISLARDEDGSDPHDAKLPSDDAFIAAALRDMGL
jgi:hypothetical protein